MPTPRLKLPHGVTFDKRQAADGWAFYFRHATLGELGRLRITDTADGKTHIVAEVTGDPADPMTAKRAAMFEPLSRAITSLVPDAPGAVTPPLPPPSRDAGDVLENKLLQCRTCGAWVARLVYAPQAIDAGRFEDHARLLFPTLAQWPVPTWIIGPMLGDGDPLLRPSDIMQVLPQRGPIRRLSPAQFNPLLDALVDRHCLAPG